MYIDLRWRQSLASSSCGSFPLFSLRVKGTRQNHTVDMDRIAQKDIVPSNIRLEAHNTNVSCPVAPDKCPGFIFNASISMAPPPASHYEPYWRLSVLRHTLCDIIRLRPYQQQNRRRRVKHLAVSSSTLYPE